MEITNKALTLETLQNYVTYTTCSLRNSEAKSQDPRKLHMIFSRSLEFPLLFLFTSKFHIAVGIYPSQYSYKFHVLNSQPPLPPPLPHPVFGIKQAA